MANRERACLF